MYFILLLIKTERAVPVAIWKAEDAVLKHYLKTWWKSPGKDAEDVDVRNVVDWEYHRDRFAKTVQKIITIPSALQSTCTSNLTTFRDTFNEVSKSPILRTYGKKLL